MSNSTTLLDTIAANQANKEAVVNALLDAASAGMIWGRHASACSGLVWGYYGGQYGTNAIANGTVTLTASTTNYVYADNSTGAVSVNTTGVPTGKIPLYSIITGTTTVSSFTDLRSYAPMSQAGPNFGNQNANYVFAGPTTGAAAAPAFRALVPADYPVFIGSGASHAAGAVPDPGSTSGTTKYLREDGTWTVPPTGSTISGLSDVNVTEGPGIDGYSLVWDNASAKWIAHAPGGSGTVTSVSATQGVETSSGSAITAAGTIRGNLIPTIYTAAHTIVTGDRGAALVMNSASAISQALPTAGGTNFPSGWYCDIANIGAGVTTVTVPTGASLDGVTNGTLALSQNTGISVFTDGTNWFTLRGASSASGGLANDAPNYAGANHPTTTGFSTSQSSNMSGGVNTLANLASGRGFTWQVQQPTTSAAEYNAFATQAAPGGSSWSIVAMVAWNVGTIGTYNKCGLCVLDASNNWVAFGWGFANTGKVGDGAYLAAGGASLNTTPTFNQISGMPSVGVTCWLKVTYTAGGNFVFYTSLDGETWLQRYSVSVTATIGTPTKTGLYQNSNDQSGVAAANMAEVLSVFHYFQG